MRAQALEIWHIHAVDVLLRVLQTLVVFESCGRGRLIFVAVQLVPLRGDHV